MKVLILVLVIIATVESAAYLRLTRNSFNDQSHDFFPETTPVYEPIRGQPVPPELFGQDFVSSKPKSPEVVPLQPNEIVGQTNPLPPVPPNGVRPIHSESHSAVANAASFQYKVNDPVVQTTKVQLPNGQTGYQQNYHQSSSYAYQHGSRYEHRWSQTW